MVKVYMTTTERLPDPKACPSYMDGLPAERKDKIMRFVQQKDRKLALGASLLLKNVLNLYGKSLAELTYSENGKPEIEGVYFNLSHSNGIAVCAVSSKAVGCDVEKIAALKGNIAQRFFCESENAYLNQFEGMEQEEEFFRLWTMKESYMKMTGEGMRLPLNCFEFRMEEPIRVVRQGKVLDCTIKEYHIPGYKMTVCGQEREYEDHIVFINCMKN